MATILVVDDCQEILDLLSMILDDAGHEVVATLEPTRALLLCEEVDFDLVICDVCMRDDLESSSASPITGMEVMLRLSDIHPNLPVIVMSGDLEREALHKIARLGFAGILLKPLRQEVVLKVVETALVGGVKWQPSPLH